MADPPPSPADPPPSPARNAGPRGATVVILALLAIVSLGTSVLMVVFVTMRSGADPVIFTPPGPNDGFDPGDRSDLFQRPQPLPEFTLTDRFGEPFGSDQLRGRVWVAGFVFTRCTTICPRIMSRMHTFQNAWSQSPQWEDIRLVLISVDPEHDTPEVLRRTASALDADPTHWRWLTGARDRIWSLIETGFLLPVSDDPGAEMPIAHSSKLVLVDPSHRIRGYYDSENPAEMDRLTEDAFRLVAQTLGDEPSGEPAVRGDAPANREP